MDIEPPGNGPKGHQGQNGFRIDEQVPARDHGTRGMWLSDLSVRQPVFVTMLVVAVVLVGLISYSRLAVNLMPDVSLQVISIRTGYSGAAPGEIERSVTRPDGGRGSLRQRREERPLELRRGQLPGHASSLTPTSTSRLPPKRSAIGSA